MTTTVKTRRPTKKEIWDWNTLVDALSAGERLSRQTDVSQLAIEAVERRFRYGTKPPLAQMDERVVAVGGEAGIALWYLHTPKQTDISRSTLHDWVHVYPCAGGRTTYRIDDGVNGWFANKHLPINATDRRYTGGYRSDQWWHGQSGVYQKGQGPYYPDAGPQMCNQRAQEVMDLTAAATHLPESWREAACKLVVKVNQAVAPFRDVLERYEMAGYDPEQASDAWAFRSSQPYTVGGDKASRTLQLSARNALTIRLKSPCIAGDGGWEVVPDLAVTVLGECPAFDEGAQVAYATQLLHPAGPRSSVEFHSDQYSTGVPFMVTRHQSKVVEAARQWAAGRIYIPCV